MLFWNFGVLVFKKPLTVAENNLYLFFQIKFGNKLFFQVIILNDLFMDKGDKFLN